MRRILILRTAHRDSLATEMAQLQAALSEHEVETIDLTCENPNYEILLRALFDADSVQVY